MSTSAFEDLEAARDGVVAALVRALQPVIPRGFRAKVTIVLDNGVVRPENVTMELRKPQGSSV